MSVRDTLIRFRGRVALGNRLPLVDRLRSEGKPWAEVDQIVADTEDTKADPTGERIRLWRLRQPSDRGSERFRLVERLLSEGLTWKEIVTALADREGTETDQTGQSTRHWYMRQAAWRS